MTGIIGKSGLGYFEIIVGTEVALISLEYKEDQNKSKRGDLCEKSMC